MARPTDKAREVEDWTMGFMSGGLLQTVGGGESKGKPRSEEVGSPKGPEIMKNKPMRHLLPLWALWVSTFSASAQWSIFAEKIPTPGHWAYYQMERTKGQEPTTVSNLRLSVHDGGVVNGQPHLWLTVDSVEWLGSKSKAPLHFLLPANLNREGAYKFLESSAEILFSDPKGPWHMTPDDLSALAKRVGYKCTNKITPDPDQTLEELNLGNQKYKCSRLKMESYTIIDPPVVAKQTIIIRGDVWRDESKPFSVIQAKWTEKYISGSKISTEEKNLKLLAQGDNDKPNPPTDHGDDFSFWRVIFPH